MTAEALEHLSRSDPVLRRLIRRVGPCTLIPDRRLSPFESLVSAVANQQLNGTAARTILKRFIALFPGKRFPAALDLSAVDDFALRAVGFSRAKVAAIRDIAKRTVEGHVPTSRR